MLKELINKKINCNYDKICGILNTSEWGAKEIINNNGITTIEDIEKLLKFIGIEIVEDKKKIIKYELQTEVNQKIFRNYASYWIMKKKYEVRESTISNYANLLKNVIIPCLGDIPLENFNNKILQHFAYWAKENGGIEGKGISEHYISDCVLLIKAIIRDGQEEKVFPEFLIKQTKIPKTLQIETKKTYTEDEYKKILEYIFKNLNNRSVGILIGIFTGMRIGEICALKWEDIDLEEKMINVNKTLQRIYNPLDEFEKSKIVITPCKTSSSQRTIPIANDLNEVLKQFKDDKDNYVLSGKIKYTEPRTFRKQYDIIMNKCGVDRIKFHSLRHTFASINIENGADVKTISEILGHSDINITLKTYTHISKKQKTKAIDKFNRLFETQDAKIEFTNKYKGNVCCINKKNGKCDFIGSIKDVAEYLAETPKNICSIINGIIEDDSYNIVPKIIGITHDKSGIYVGG
ncbi:MAG: site-specific integrase [Bacilli bacterium]